jgi:hypothetical protein
LPLPASTIVFVDAALILAKCGGAEKTAFAIATMDPGCNDGATPPLIPPEPKTVALG